MNRIILTASIMLAWLSCTAAIPDSTAAIKLYELSEALYSKGQCAKADVAATKAVRTFEQLNMGYYAASCYNVICIASQRMGNMQRALAYGRKLYGMDMRSGVKEDLSSSLNNLATLYLYDNQPREAEKFVLKSIETEKPLKRKGRLAIRYGLACEIYTSLGDYDRAERYGEAAYRLDCADSLDANAAKRLSQLAALYNIKSEKTADGPKNKKTNILYLEKAEQLYRRALAILESHGEMASVIIDYNQLGSVLAKQGKRTEARQCHVKALTMAKQAGNDDQTLKSCDALADLLATDEPREALAYRSMALSLQRKIFNRRSEEQLNNFTIESEVAEKDAQIALQEVRLKNQRIIRWALITALLLVIVAFAQFFFAYRMKRRRNEELTKANAMKDKFFSIISHDMKNPVIAQRDTLTAMVENVEHLDKASIFEIGSEMLIAQKELLDMITNLLDWSRLQMGTLSFTPIRLDLNSLTEKVESQTHSQLERKRLTLHRDIPAGTIVTADRNMLIIVMRNLMSNAAKYSHEGGEIRLKASRPTAEGRVQISVEDDGIGMSRETQARLLSLGTSRSAKGTKGEQGTGLGLIICRDMLQLHGTGLHVESEEGKGTKLWFEL